MYLPGLRGGLNYYQRGQSSANSELRLNKGPKGPFRRHYYVTRQNDKKNMILKEILGSFPDSVRQYNGVLAKQIQIQIILSKLPTLKGQFQTNFRNSRK